MTLKNLYLMTPTHFDLRLVIGFGLFPFRSPLLRECRNLRRIVFCSSAY